MFLNHCSVIFSLAFSLTDWVLFQFSVSLEFRKPSTHNAGSKIYKVSGSCLISEIRSRATLSTLTSVPAGQRRLDKIHHIRF